MILLLTDSREQEPLSFEGHEGVDKIEVIGLPFGDYTAMCGENEDSLKQIPVIFERKSIADLYGTMTNGYDRFRKEIERAKEARFKLILVTEGTYAEVSRGYEYSTFSGKSMIKKLHTLYVKYDLEWFPCDSRKVMAHHISSTFSAIERNWTKDSSIDTGFKEKSQMTFTKS